MNAVKRVILGALLCGAIGMAYLFMSLGTASADTHILVGGNTDCTSQGLLNVKAAQGDLQGNPVPVSYGDCSGDFGPFVGGMAPNVAIQQGVDATRAAWNQYCSNGDRCVIEGFSIGAAPVSIVGNDVGADKPGSNTHVVTDGNAWGKLGVFGPQPALVGSFIKIGAPVIGVPVNIPQVAGSENRFGVNDGWADNSGQPPWAEITQLSTINGAGDVPPQHFVPDGAPTGTFVTDDGVTQESYGDPLFGVVPPADNALVDPNLVP